MVQHRRGRPSKSATGSKPDGASQKIEQTAIKIPDTVQVSTQPNVKITFLHVGEDLTLPTLMVDSVLKAMPGAEIIQMTDMVTPQIKGVSSVVRKPYNGLLMTFRMQHLASLDGEWITLDTDVIVKKDLRVVFDKDFDVALTKRYSSIFDGDGNDVAKIMPYNTGVMFSRNKLFWKNSYKMLLSMPESAHKWWGDQLSVRICAESKKFNVLELDCDEYNYPPTSESDKKDVFVLHYKGKRKDWMINGYS